MPPRPAPFAAYVPRLALRLCPDGGDYGPRDEWLPGALLSADLCGSTALAERLAARGPAGAEALGDILNAQLGALADLVVENGGDVLKLTGDGLFALWPDEDEDAAVGRAVACAAAAEERLRVVQAPHLSLRFGVGLGRIRAMSVAWDADHLDLIVTAAPVADTCRAERNAGPGEILLTEHAWAAAGSGCMGEVRPDGFTRLTGLRGRFPSVGTREIALGARAAETLRRWVPPAVRARLAAGQEEWLAEHRRVTVLFVRLPDWTSVSMADAQATIAAIASVLSRSDGVVSRLGMGEAGPVVKLAFGLPPVAHEDDPVRATRAAMDIQDALRGLDVETSIGVATGSAFCGAIGSANRREYTTVGDAVNLAARLMQAAGRRVLCDGTTHAAAASRLTFDAVDPVSVKGKRGPVPAYRPRGMVTAPVAPGAIIGRATERARLERGLEEVAGGGSVTVVIEGEAGIGKSCLVAELTVRAAARGFATLYGAGEAIEASTPYLAWRRIVTRLLRLELTQERAGRRDYVRALLEHAPESRTPSSLDLAPLLNPLVGLDLPETELTAALSPDARAENTQELVLRLLEGRAGPAPLLVVIEDAQWLDSASWGVAHAVAQRARSMMLVLVTRSLPEPLPAEYRRLPPALQRVPLSPLSAEETRLLAAQALGVSRVGDAVADLIQERSGGNPFFAEQLAWALRDAGIALGPVSLEQLRRRRLPDTIHGVVTGRLDAAGPRPQLVLKVASVFGPSFSLDALRDVHPIAADRRELAGDLTALEAMNLVRAETEGAEARYAFRHAITRDAAYALLPFAQRRALHAAVADWYERRHADDLAPHYALLAHHRKSALDPDGASSAEAVARAREALGRAGEQAFASYANREAVQLFSDALRLGDAGTPRWERELGEACFRLGDASAAIAHLEQALALLDRPVPRGRAGLAAAFAREIGVQGLHLLGLTGFDRRGRESGVADTLEAARAYELLGLIRFLMMESAASLVANLRSLNLSETVPPSAERANGCATIGMSAGVVLGRRVAERYFRRGLASGRAAGDEHACARVWHMNGFYLIGEGQWADAQAALERARRIFERLGDTRWREMTLLTLGNLHQMHRRYAESLPCYAEAERTSAQRGDVQARAWSAVGRGGALQALGRLDEALAVYERMAAWLADDMTSLADRGSEFSVCGIKALAHLRRGDCERAWTLAAEAADLTAGSPLLIYYALPGRTSVAQVALGLWERGYDPPFGDVRRAARRAVADLRTFAHWFPIARPQAHLWQGVLHRLRLKPAKARGAWRRAAAEAARLDMPHDEALVHHEIARQLARDDPERRTSLEAARRLFEQAGAALEAAAVRAELDGDPAPLATVA